MITDTLETIANTLRGVPTEARNQEMVATLLQQIADNLTASADHPGIVELATTAEASAGSATDKAVTPAGLATAVPAASATAAGKVELATSAETIAVTDQTRAVTPYGLGAALAKLFAISFTGAAAAGACTATGVAVGDVIFSVTGITDMGLVDAKFEGTVTVVNQIQQVAAENLSAKNFLALVYHPA